MQDEEASPDDRGAGWWIVAAIQVAAQGGNPSYRLVQRRHRPLRYRNGQVFFAGEALSLRHSYGLSKYELGAGNISEDARGRWYLNVTIRIEKTPKPTTSEIERSVGIDLGLKDFAATSDARVIKLVRHHRKLEAQREKAQRARKKARLRALHANIKNSRKDRLHKLSTAFVPV